MARVKNKDTDIEKKLRKRLWALGYRYKLNSKLVGKPDIVFLKQKIAIFCDGDFWHGRYFDKEKSKYKEFWINKIKRNIDRDERVNETLRNQGWIVLRFWKKEINREVDECVNKVINQIDKSHI